MESEKEYTKPWGDQSPKDDRRSETRVDVNGEKGMMGLVQEPRANSSGTAVSTDGQGVSVYQEYSEFFPFMNL